MHLGEISTIIFFGGGKVLLNIINDFRENNFKIYLFSSKRLLNEIYEKKSFSEHLLKNNVKYFQTNNINDDKNINGLITKNVLGLSFGAPWIFKKDLINKFGGRLLNMHCRRLPKYRGGGGFSWLIMNNYKKGCSLLHKLEVGIDTGPIVKKTDFNFPRHLKTPAEFEDFQYKKDIKFLLEFIRDIKFNKKFDLVDQNDNSEYWPRLYTPLHGYINWSWDLNSILSFINAFESPYQGASTFINGKKVFIKNCSIITSNDFHPFQNGIIYRKSASKLFVSTDKGTLVVGKVFLENGQSAFKIIKAGDRLHTPNIYLDKALSSRAVIKPDGSIVNNNNQ